MAGNTKQKIIEVAYQLFQENDADKIGVREIAAGAGVTTGSFYHHFKDKYDVLSAKMEGNEKDILIYPEIPFDGTRLERVRHFFTSYMARFLMEDGVRIARIVYLTEKLSERESRSLVDTISRLMDDVVEAREIHEDVDAHHYGRLLLDAFRGTAIAWCRGDGSDNLTDRLEEVMDIYLAYIKK